MKPPFDIAADLDTPVSAYLKLAPFRPRFLLESVEGGERLARYSFIGFGDCLEVRLDASGLHVGDAHSPRPSSKAEFLNALRACARRVRLSPSRKFPACRCRAAWSATRHTMPCATSNGCPGAVSRDTSTPHAHYVAPCSLLVFDHLTRSVALLHDGTRGGAAKPAPRSHAGAARCGPDAFSPARRAFLARHALAHRGCACRPACGARKNTSPRAMCISWCSPRASRDVTRSHPSRCIERCGC